MQVAIAGYGVEGKASARYWQALGADVTIVDERDTLEDISDFPGSVLGKDAFERLDGFDLVIRSPGIRPDKIQTDGKIWSATNEFFAQCPAPIIGVTGTKGKGTTCSLIASILRAAGRRVHLVGNIGSPALEVLASIEPDDIVVYEMSSFQLWDAERSPHIAVILPIEADHLDVHTDFSEYISAKANIAHYQTAQDIIVYHQSNQYSLQVAEQSRADDRRPYPFATNDDVLGALKLPGQHNRDNAGAAIAATKNYVHDPQIIKNGLASFEGLPHRLKFVSEKNDVKYYDDSISTTPGSVIAAVNSFPDTHKLVILGGSDKGADYVELVKYLAHTETSVIAIGATGGKIAELCRALGVAVKRIDGLMDEVIAEAARQTRPGEVVLLSPASASFDQYENYVARGEAFIAAVSQL